MFQRLLLLALLGAIILPCSAAAQGVLSVKGSLLDATGATIAGSPIHMESLQGAVVAEATTDDRGAFSFLNLPAGDFFLVVPPYSSFARSSLPVHLTSPLVGLKVILKL